MNLQQQFYQLIKMHHGTNRWVYLQYVLLLAGMFLFGLASEATLGELWTYLALLPIFVIQLVWPTIFGWRVLFAGWFMFFFLFDVFGGAPPGVFPIFWGLGL